MELKTGSLLSLSILVLFGHLAFSMGDDEAWLQYKVKFNKTYASEAEEMTRKQIFLDNKHYIESHNTLHALESLPRKFTFTQGFNHLSDMTTEEINQSLNGFRLPNDFERPEEELDSMLETILQSLNSSIHQDTSFSKAWYDRLAVPDSLDWRASGRVSKVKDQGKCGSCWSFATVGALESILAGRGKPVLLSEQNLVDCSRAYGNHGCNGGLMDLALRYVRDHGIMSAADYQYTAKDESCKYVRSKAVTRVRGSTILPRGSEVLLRIALALSGPIPVAIDAGARSFQSYESGVYNDRVCRSSNNALNHAVLLVGYGTDKVGGDYWIIKNSWGSKWGASGYVKLARNRGNLCGVASYAVLPIP